MNHFSASRSCNLFMKSSAIWLPMMMLRHVKEFVCAFQPDKQFDLDSFHKRKAIDWMGGGLADDFVRGHPV